MYRTTSEKLDEIHRHVLDANQILIEYANDSCRYNSVDVCNLSELLSTSSELVKILDRIDSAVVKIDEEHGG